MPDESVQCVVTSPPYWGLRDYGLEPVSWPDGWHGCLGLEPTPELYVEHLVSVFAEIRRVLRGDGTVWLNLGDSYAATGKSGGGAQGKRWAESGADHTGPRGGKWRPAPDGLKPKDLCMIPARVAIALQADGWYLRSDIIWAKPNPMPESVRDRPTRSHEHIFLLSKSERYFYDADSIREPFVTDEKENYPARSRITGRGDQDSTVVRNGGPDRGKSGGYPPRGCGRNRRDVWFISPKPFRGAHFATFPPDLVEPCIKAGCPEGGTVLDPFGGSGTVGMVASRLGRDYILIEANPDYCHMAEQRIAS